MNIAILATGIFKENKEATKITTSSLAKELIKKQHYVAIITKNKGGLPETSIEEGIPVFRSAFGEIVSYPASFKRAQEHNHQKFDIIHGFSSAPILLIRSLLSKYFFSPKAKIVHTLKSYSKKEMGRQFFRLLNQADAITVPTTIFANSLIEAGVKSEKIKVIHSHIDLEKFRPFSEAEKAKLKAKLGLPNLKGKKIIFYYGATWKEKGLDYLLHAFAALIRKREDLLLLIAPRYSLELQHQETIRRLNITGDCKIIETPIEVEYYLNAVDVCVLPYENIVGTEGNPSCLLEAMACKTPVVTSDLPELREIVEHEKEVLMAKPKDIKSLQTEIEKILDTDDSHNHGLLQKLIENGFQKSREFDLKKITQKYAEMYLELSKKI